MRQDRKPHREKNSIEGTGKRIAAAAFIISLFLSPAFFPATAYAATTVPSEFLMPGTQNDEELFGTDGSCFGFGDREGPRHFVNRYAGYQADIPETLSFSYGKERYASLYYAPEDALSAGQAAIDLMIVSKELTDERPDPEELTDNAMVLLTCYLRANQTDGTPVDAQSYIERLFAQALGGTQLLPYMEAEDSSFLGQNYRHFRLDYTKALQEFYRSRYQDGKEHPAFDERFSFVLDAYVRRLNEEYFIVYSLRSGEENETAESFLNLLRPL